MGSCSLILMKPIHYLLTTIITLIIVALPAVELSDRITALETVEETEAYACTIHTAAVASAVGDGWTADKAKFVYSKCIGE